MEKRYDVFISYRRDGGEATAKILHDKLCDLGYQVFFDVESLRSGLFNLKLYSVIDECTDVVVVLSPGALDRCENEGDWLRREVEYALEKGKNIIPIMLRGFNFPEKLPESIETLPYMQGLQANIEYFDAFVDKLQSFILSPRRLHPGPASTRNILTAYLPVMLTALVVIVGVVLLLNNRTDPDLPPDPSPVPNTETPDSPPTESLSAGSNTDDPSGDMTPEPNEPERDKHWLSNVLMVEVEQDVTEDTGVLGSDIARKEILSVTFLDSLDDMPEDAWDVSEGQNKRVMAWTVARDDGYDLYIGAKGGIMANWDSSHLFYAYTNMEQIHINGNFHTDNVRDMFAMFYRCESLTALDVSKFNTSHVTNMSWMFSSCYSLVTINVSGFDTSKVTDMSNMFSVCWNLEKLNISDFNTSCVKSMAAMFSDCRNLSELKLDVSKFNTSNVKDMNHMLFNCESLAELNVSKFDTSKAMDMTYMFYGCKSLTELNVRNFDTSNVTNMYAMFYECSKVTELDVSKFKTSNVTSMGWMFGRCTNLKQLDVSRFDTSNVTDTQDMFTGCGSLENLNLSNFAPELIDSMGLSM